jgi:hypothetical protein
VRIRRDEVTWQELDDEVVALDLTSSEYLRLNGSGAVLWRRLVEGAEVDELEALLVETYGIDAATASADAAAFVQRLEERGLLEPARGDG